MALGSTANQDIVMRPRGAGTFSVEYGGVSKFRVSSAGALSGPWQGYYFALRNINTCVAGIEKIKTTTAAEATVRTH